MADQSAWFSHGGAWHLSEVRTFIILTTATRSQLVGRSLEPGGPLWSGRHRLLAGRIAPLQGLLSSYTRAATCCHDSQVLTMAPEGSPGSSTRTRFGVAPLVPGTRTARCTYRWSMPQYYCAVVTASDEVLNQTILTIQNTISTWLDRTRVVSHRGPRFLCLRATSTPRSRTTTILHINNTIYILSTRAIVSPAL